MLNPLKQYSYLFIALNHLSFLSIPPTSPRWTSIAPTLPSPPPPSPQLPVLAHFNRPAVTNDKNVQINNYLELLYENLNAFVNNATYSLF